MQRKKQTIYLNSYSSFIDNRYNILRFNMASQKKLVTCFISKKQISIDDAVPYELISPKIITLIKQKYPDFKEDAYLSREEHKKFRYQYMENILVQEKGELSKIDKEVVRSLIEQESLVKKLNTDIKGLTKGQRIADKVAEFGGSWSFIIAFFIILFCWILINTIILISKPYDPFPFILLNLILSCLAAIQAPIIMMSQNRKEDKDRQRAENDYKINLKAELEIRHLHDKLDHLTRDQWQRLLEIQEMQIDLLQEKERIKKSK